MYVQTTRTLKPFIDVGGEHATLTTCTTHAPAFRTGDRRYRHSAVRKAYEITSCARATRRSGRVTTTNGLIVSDPSSDLTTPRSRAKCPRAAVFKTSVESAGGDAKKKTSTVTNTIDRRWFKAEVKITRTLLSLGRTVFGAVDETADKTNAGNRKCTSEAAATRARRNTFNSLLI